MKAKYYIIPFLLLIISYSCTLDNRTDLAQTSIATVQAEELFSEAEMHNQFQDMWGFPLYYTYQLEGFKVGNVKLMNYTDDVRKNKLELYRDLKDSINIYIQLSLYQEELGKELFEDLQKQYGEPITLSLEEKPEDYNPGTFLWPNTKKGQSLVLIHNYSKNGEKIDSETLFYIMQNNTPVAGTYFDGRELNSLELLLVFNSNYPHLEALRKILEAENIR